MVKQGRQRWIERMGEGGCGAKNSKVRIIFFFAELAVPQHDRWRRGREKKALEWSFVSNYGDSSYSF
jgi:hypothetical protein